MFQSSVTRQKPSDEEVRRYLGRERRTGTVERGPRPQNGDLVCQTTTLGPIAVTKRLRRTDGKSTEGSYKEQGLKKDKD